MKNLLYLIGVLLIFFAGFICNECTRIPCPEIKIDTIRTADTIYLQHKVVKPSYKPKPSKIIPADTSKPADIESGLAAAYIYQDSLVDSNLAIYITDTTAGKILGRGIEYTLKVPLQIKETIIITKTAEMPTPQRGFFVGLQAGTNLQMYRLAPEIEYLTKKGMMYSYSYDLINNLHSVGVKRKMW
jgi:hypothetical protein